MEDKSKAEKRATGRLLLQQYQKKNKNGKSRNESNQVNTPTFESQSNIKSVEFDHIKNGYPETDINNIPLENNKTKNPSALFSFQKASSPAELFFDSFRASPQQSSPEHSEKYDSSVHEMSPLPLDNITNNTVERLKDSDKSYEYCSSRSSKSDDEAIRRLYEVGGFVGEASGKEDLEKSVLETNEKVLCLENDKKKLIQDLNNLKNQLLLSEENMKIHLQTIEIIMSEKNELQLELTKMKTLNNLDKSKIEDLTIKLKISEEEVDKLKKEIFEIYEAREQHNTILKKLEHNLAEVNKTSESHRKEVIDSKEEINFLKQKISQMINHVQDMKKQIDDKDKQLSLAEMRLAQLGGGGIPTKAEVNKLGEAERECARLKEDIVKLHEEKSDTVSQYQQYIDTLNSQIQLLNQQYESCLTSKNQLLTREESLVKHIGELEKKLQKEHQAGPSLVETNSKLSHELKEAEAKIAELTSSLNKKNDKIVQLSTSLEETSTKLNEAELSLERLEVPDARKLQAAIENDRVAAIRAVQQNTQLKNNIVELQEAIVKLNNEKLELTEKWQHTEHVLSETMREFKKMKTKKEIELQDAVAQCAVIFHSDNSCQADIDGVDMPIEMDHVTPEALALLEKKLKKTMNDYAALYDEKQQLEHLVLHLQSETETIGDYVTLYQNQRSLLQERAQERDKQMDLLSKEKEELRLKLAKISSLLPKVIEESATEPPKSDGMNNGDDSTAIKIKTLLNEIETSNLMKEGIAGVHNNFHPCLLCSGKLITI